MDFYESVINDIKAMVINSIEKNGFPKIDVTNEFSDEKLFGDISCSVAFKIAKLAKKNPQQIAEIISKMEKPDYIEAIKAEGGFVNFYFDKNIFSKRVLDQAINKKPNPNKEGEKVIIEYPSVNPNKPWHLGHLRNALIGETISNVYDACGYLVERENYIDDMGLQIVETLWGYLNINNTPSKKYDHWLGELYVEVNKLLQEKKDEINKELSSLNVALEDKNSKESRLTREISEKCVMAQYDTASAYKIFHDVLIWESDILKADIFDKAISLLEKSGVVRKEKEGKYADCIIIDFSKVENLPDSFKGLEEPVKVLVRSNATATYAAKDIAFHMWKFGLIPNPFRYSVFMEKQFNGKKLYTTSAKGENLDFGNVKKAINIIDFEQNYEQEIVKLAFKILGRDDIAKNLVHLGYNTVELEGGTFSGRKGTWIGYTADDLMNEAEKRAVELINGNSNIKIGEKALIAKAVALAAIKFEFLRVSPEKKIIFTWERALNFEGISGPYCQYMYARANKIVKNSGFELHEIKDIDKVSITASEEFELIKKISKKGLIINKACYENRPNVITDYAGELAVMFSKFYENVPVIKARSHEEAKNRTAIVYAFMSAIKDIFDILGIEALEKM